MSVRRRSFLAAALLRSTTCLILPSLAMFAVSAAAAQDVPSGSTVVAGKATITQGHDGLVIQQGTDRAVIDWKSFSVGAGKSVAFHQPNAASAILNRVTGGDISRIAGSLTSNGQMFLINRNGVVITPTGRVVATGGFVVSTLDIRNDDFMAGRLRFSGGGGGAILNQGRILTGAGAAIALLGGTVSNEGLLSAPLGKVMIGSASAATLDLSGQGYLQLALPSDIAGDDGRALIDNSGRIEGAQVVMRVATAADVVRRVVNMSGVIAASRVGGQDGMVTLDGGTSGTTAISGVIDASGGTTGGAIDITGGTVALTGAQLLASGVDTGGRVRVGGAFQGGKISNTLDAYRFGPQAALHSASFVSIDGTSRIDVSGSLKGGSVVAWSDRGTQQRGTIRATGAIGGAVELSSVGTLSTALTQVSTGKNGLLLLDPKNIWIGSAPFPNSPGQLALTPTVAFGDANSDPASETSYIDDRDIRTLVESGTNVRLQANNDITWGGNDTTYDLTVTNPGDISLVAGRNIILGGTFSFANVNFSALANATAADGVIAAERDTFKGGIDTFNASLFGGAGSGGTGGDITLKVGAGLTANSADNLRIGPVQGRNVTIAAGPGTSRIGFFPNTAVQTAIDNVQIVGSSSVTLSGRIYVNTVGGLTVTAPLVNWTTEGTTAIGGYSDAPVKFIENGTLVRYGILNSNSDQTRLALGAAGTAPQYSATYGSAYPAFDALHIVRGSLASGDTLNAILAAGSTTSSGPPANASGGDYDVVTKATRGFDFAQGVSGYFVDLRTHTDQLRITQNMLVPTLVAGNYTYGSPAPLVTLTGLKSGDSVNLNASLSAGGTSVLSYNGSTGYAFPTTLRAQNGNFTLLSLGGASAANYTLDLTGIITSALNIARKQITYQTFDAHTTYGTAAVPDSLLNGLVGADIVTASSYTATRNGVAVAPTATLAAGNYTLQVSALSGAQADNYVLAASGNVDSPLTVSPKALTYAATAVNSVYGTLATVATPTLNGVVGSDQVTATAQILGGGTPVTLSATLGAGSYNIVPTLGGSAASNYVLAASGNSAASLIVARKPVTFSFNNSASGVFGDTVSLLTFNGVLAADTGVEPDIRINGSYLPLTKLSTGAVGIMTTAGSYSTSFLGLVGTGASNYVLDLTSGATTGTLTVAKKPITFTIDSKTNVYGDGGWTPTLSFNGLVGIYTDVHGSVGAAKQSDGTPIAFDQKTLDVGNYALTANSALTGYHADNYVVTATGSTTGLYTVTPRSVTYRLSGSSSTYGTAASLGSADLIGLVNGDAVGTTISASFNGAPLVPTDRTSVGSYTLSAAGLTGARAFNYVLDTANSVNAQLVISPKLLTFTLGNDVTTYGTLYAPSATLNGVLSGDNVGGLAYVDRRPAVYNQQAGLYTTTVEGLTGAQAANYQLAPVNDSGNVKGTLLINRKALTYTITSSGSVYGDAIRPNDVTLNGVIAGDDTTASLEVRTSNGGLINYTTPVGAYAPSVALSPGASVNYVLSPTGNIDAAYVITPRPITLQATSNLIGNVAQYGIFKPGDLGVAPIIGNLLPGDQVAFTGLTAPAYRTSTSGYIAAGTYVLSVANAALTGANAANYHIAGTTNGLLTITPKDLQSFGAVGYSLVYGTSFTPKADLPGVVAGDQAELTGFTATRDGVPVTLQSIVPVGTYTLTGSGFAGADAANYAYPSPTPFAVYTITPKTLGYNIANVTSVYGTQARPGAATLTGIVGTDAVAATTDFAGTIGAFSSVGTYGQIVTGLTGAAASNYVIGSTGVGQGVLTITPKALGYTLSGPLTVAYGDASSPVRLTGLLNGDVVSASLLATLTEALPGSGMFLSSVTNLSPELYAGTWNLTFEKGGANNVQLTGSGAGNYTLANQGVVASYRVTPRALTYRLSLAQGMSDYGTPPVATLSIDNVPNLPSYALPQTQLTRSDSSGVTGMGGSIDARTQVGTYMIGAALTGNLAFNYTLTGTQQSLTVSKRTIRSVSRTTSGTYGTALADLLSLDGILFNDAVLPTIQIGNQSVTLNPTAGGYGIGLVTYDIGTYTYSVGLTGKDVGNYVLGPDATGPLRIAPKPITYKTADFAMQYGGISMPVCAVEGCDLATYRLTNPGGAITFDGVIAQDAAAVQGSTVLLNGKGGTTYTERTAVGAYLQIVTGLTGAKSSNYVLANTGSTAGTLTINPLAVRATVAEGGRIYNGSLTAPFETVGTPGKVTVQISQSINGFIAGDDVSVALGIFDNNGTAYAGAVETIPVGDYTIRPLGLQGADASNYRFLPYGLSYNRGSQAGTFKVSNIDLFNFGFLSGNYVPYTPPVTVTTAPVVSLSTHATSSSSSSTDIGATSYATRGTADASAGVTLTTGPVNTSATVSATASGLASFSPLGVYTGGQAAAGATISVQAGPVTVSYTAGANAAGAFTIDPLSTTPSIMLDGLVRVGQTGAVGVAGGMNGVSGSASVQGSVFSEARINNDLGFDGTTVKLAMDYFVGGGASVGTTVGVSMGGVGASLGVTVYSPGSLYIGARSVSDYHDGVFTIGFDFGIAIGIGGLNLSPKLSFDTTEIIATADSISNAVLYTFTGKDNGCYSTCQKAKADAAAAKIIQDKFDKARTMFSDAGNKPSYDLINYLAANPDAAQKVANTDTGGLKAALKTYGDVPNQLNDVVNQQQALVAKIKANPNGISLADMQQATALRAQEASLIAKVSALGGQISVKDGQLVMAKKA